MTHLSLLSLLILTNEVQVLVCEQLGFGGELFSCENRLGGYYADKSDGCRSYHMCGPAGRHFRFQCPPATRFSQRFVVCDYDDRVSCFDSERFFSNKALIGQSAPITNNALDTSDEILLDSASSAKFRRTDPTDFTSDFARSNSIFNRSQRQGFSLSESGLFNELRNDIATSPSSRLFNSKSLNSPKSTTTGQHDSFRAEMRSQSLFNQGGLRLNRKPKEKSRQFNGETSGEFLMSLANSRPAPLSEFVSVASSTARENTFTSPRDRKHTVNGAKKRSYSEDFAKILLEIASGSLETNSRGHTQFQNGSPSNSQPDHIPQSTVTGNLAPEQAPSQVFPHRRPTTDASFNKFPATSPPSGNNGVPISNESPQLFGARENTAATLPANQRWRLARFESDRPGFSSARFTGVRNSVGYVNVNNKPRGTKDDTTRGASRRGNVNKVQISNKKNRSRKRFGKVERSGRNEDNFNSPLTTQTRTTDDRRFEETRSNPRQTSRSIVQRVKPARHGGAFSASSRNIADPSRTEGRVEEVQSVRDQSLRVDGTPGTVQQGVIERSWRPAGRSGGLALQNKCSPCLASLVLNWNTCSPCVRAL